jgi:ribosomal protein S18 acetylase RimI-like enzyme
VISFARRRLNIRPFRPKDLDALYAISLATALAGADASHLYDDPKMMGHIYSAPYALLEPDLALVVEEQTGVTGFVVGTVDTLAWERRLEQDWWPVLRQAYAAPPGTQMDSWTQDQRRAFMIHHPTQTPSVVAQKYPAHLHMNLLPHLRGRGVGSKLFDDWLAIAAGRGTKATHVAVNRANVGAIHFWRKLQFTELAVDGLREARTLWMGRG